MDAGDEPQERTDGEGADSTSAEQAPASEPGRRWWTRSPLAADAPSVASSEPSAKSAATRSRMRPSDPASVLEQLAGGLEESSAFPSVPQADAALGNAVTTEPAGKHAVPAGGADASAQSLALPDAPGSRRAERGGRPARGGFARRRKGEPQAAPGDPDRARAELPAAEAGGVDGDQQVRDMVRRLADAVAHLSDLDRSAEAHMEPERAQRAEAELDHKPAMEPSSALNHSLTDATRRESVAASLLEESEQRFAEAQQGWETERSAEVGRRELIEQRLGDAERESEVARAAQGEARERAAALEAQLETQRAEQEVQSSDQDRAIQERAIEEQRADLAERQLVQARAQGADIERRLTETVAALDAVQSAHGEALARATAVEPQLEAQRAEFAETLESQRALAQEKLHGAAEECASERQRSELAEQRLAASEQASAERVSEAQLAHVEALERAAELQAQLETQRAEHVAEKRRANLAEQRLAGTERALAEVESKAQAAQAQALERDAALQHRVTQAEQRAQAAHAHGVEVQRVSGGVQQQLTAAREQVAEVAAKLEAERSRWQDGVRITQEKLSGEADARKAAEQRLAKVEQTAQAEVLVHRQAQADLSQRFAADARRLAVTRADLENAQTRRVEVEQRLREVEREFAALAAQSVTADREAPAANAPEVRSTRPTASARPRPRPGR